MIYVVCELSQAFVLILFCSIFCNVCETRTRVHAKNPSLNVQHLNNSFAQKLGRGEGITLIKIGKEYLSEVKT